jgi:hypothetical protein
MMKIMLCASFQFAAEMLEVKEDLEGIGHDVVLMEDAYTYAKRPHLKQDKAFETRKTKDDNVLRSMFEMLAGCDGILVLNYTKKGIQGYIGASTLMEIGVAYYLKKQIYLMYPYQPDASFAVEMDCVEATVLNGNVRMLSATNAIKR